jgi:ABC-type Na+ efflux pump permease subunit
MRNRAQIMDQTARGIKLAWRKRRIIIPKKYIPKTQSSPGGGSAYFQPGKQRFPFLMHNFLVLMLLVLFLFFFFMFCHNFLLHSLNRIKEF